MTSSQVPVTNSDYMAGRSDDGGRTAPHVSMYSGFEHDSSTGVGVEMASQLLHSVGGYLFPNPHHSVLPHGGTLAVEIAR